MASLETLPADLLTKVGGLLRPEDLAWFVVSQMTAEGTSHPTALSVRLPALLSFHTLEPTKNNRTSSCVVVKYVGVCVCLRLHPGTDRG